MMRALGEAPSEVGVALLEYCSTFTVRFSQYVSAARRYDDPVYEPTTRWTDK